ncbi:hypothetical protein LIER_31148 [Lithospermum erythrorhizon]|uniref:Uncharacterized protein n=1 Tax=Lithospermum erythrorhizon TaxID=34254 RepID=A0AAV3RQ09_LITER
MRSSVGKSSDSGDSDTVGTDSSGSLRLWGDNHQISPPPPRSRLIGTADAEVVDLEGALGAVHPHWCTDEQRAISLHAAQNSLCFAGRPDRRCSVHALGSKGIHDLIFEEEHRTGKTPSALGIRLDLNKKKDKVTYGDMGDVYVGNMKY